MTVELRTFNQNSLKSTSYEQVHILLINSFGLMSINCAKLAPDSRLGNYLDLKDTSLTSTYHQTPARHRHLQACVKHPGFLQFSSIILYISRLYFFTYICITQNDFKIIAKILNPNAAPLFTKTCKSDNQRNYQRTCK